MPIDVLLFVHSPTTAWAQRLADPETRIFIAQSMLLLILCVFVLRVFNLSHHVVKNSRANPFKNMATSLPPSLDDPYNLSTNTMGTSATEAPWRTARTTTSI